MITKRQITEYLTVTEYAQWLQYRCEPGVATNYLANGEEAWDDYEFHRFYTNMMLGVTNEDQCKKWSDIARGESVALANATEGNGVGKGDRVHTYDHIPQRRDTHGGEPTLYTPCSGFANERFTADPPPRVYGSTETDPGESV